MPSSYGIAQRDAPATFDADGTSTEFRLGRYGDTSTISMGDSHSQLANEGCYYKACTNTRPTSTTVAVFQFVQPGPGVFTAVGGNQNQAPLTVLNTAGLSGGPRIYFDYIKLMIDQPGNLATVLYCNWVISVNNYDRNAIVNTAAGSPVPFNVNSDFPNESVCRLSVNNTIGNQSLVTQPTANPKVVAQGQFKRSGAAAFVTGDCVVLDFGDHSGSSQPLTGTTARQYAQSTGPLAIGPGQFMALHLWGNISAAGGTVQNTQMQLDMGWWER